MTKSWESCGARNPAEPGLACHLAPGHEGDHAAKPWSNSLGEAPRWTGDADVDLVRSIHLIRGAGCGITITPNDVTLHAPRRFAEGSVTFRNVSMHTGVELALGAAAAMARGCVRGPDARAIERSFWLGLCAGEDVVTLMHGLRSAVNALPGKPGPCGPGCPIPTSLHEFPCYGSGCTARCSNPTCETGAFCVLAGPHALHGCADCGTAARDVAQEAGHG